MKCCKCGSAEVVCRAVQFSPRRWFRRPQYKFEPLCWDCALTHPPNLPLAQLDDLVPFDLTSEGRLRREAKWEAGEKTFTMLGEWPLPPEDD